MQQHLCHFAKDARSAYCFRPMSLVGRLVSSLYMLALLSCVATETTAQTVNPSSIEFGVISANSTTGVHLSRSVSIRNDLDEPVAVLTVGIRPPFESATGVVQALEGLPAVITPGDSLSVVYRMIVAARTHSEYRDTIRVVVRYASRPGTDTLVVPVAASLTMSAEPFGSTADMGTQRFCRCAGIVSPGISRTISTGSLYLVNPGTEVLTLDSFRVAGSPGIQVNDSIRVFDAAWSGSGPLPSSRFRRPPVRILAGTTANVLFQLLAIPEGPKAVVVTYYLRRPSGDTLTVTSIGWGTVVERNSVLAPLRQFPLIGANSARVSAGSSDSTSLTLALYKCTVPDDAAVTIESIKFGQPGLLSLMSKVPSEPLRVPPLTMVDCAGRVPEAFDTNVIEYRIRFTPTRSGVTIDTAVIIYSYPTSLGTVRDSMYAVYFLEAMPSAGSAFDEERAELLLAVPNPASAGVWIEGVSASVGAAVVVDFYDPAGRVVARMPASVEADGRVFVKRPPVNAGAYSVAVTSGTRLLGTTRVVFTQ